MSKKQPPSKTNNTNLSTVSSSTDSQSSLTTILRLEELDPNLYRGNSPEYPRWGRIYGGQTVAQALVAATKTVQSKFVVHSLHSYFIRPGDDNIPILYSVDRARDGTSFCTRRVAAIQKGRAIFTMEVSFHVIEPGLSHQYVMPAVPPPDECIDWNLVRKDAANDPRFHKAFRRMAKLATDMPFSFELRRVGINSMDDLLKPRQPVQYIWMRVSGKLDRSDQQLHQCALAYLSDFSLLETSMLAHGTHWHVADESGTGSKIQPASIDHAMWFHAPVYCDEWLLYECESPATAGGRGFNIGRVYRMDGTLAVSTAQEGLIRVRDWDGLSPAIKKVANPTSTHAYIVTTKLPVANKQQPTAPAQSKL